jgi:hypothetical protein
VLAFVTEHLTLMYRRSLSGTDRTWCAEWWRHTEAESRLEALWRSWEYLRVDPNLGISVWMRDHLDHHMAILLDRWPVQRLQTRPVHERDGGVLAGPRGHVA